MNPLTQSKNTTILPVLIALTLGCFGLSPQARAECRDGCDGTNTFQGEDALLNNTNGTSNTAIGFQALFSFDGGGNNTALGTNALFSLINGGNNTAIGWQALFSTTTTFFNTAIGGNALYNNTGANNTAIGDTALVSNTTGGFNTAVGVQALFSNTTGHSNIAVGDFAGFFLTTGSENIDIENGGAAGDSGVIRIGSAGTHTATFIAGIREAPLVQGVAVAVGITADGQLGVRASSARFKEAIKPMDKTSEAIFSLQPVTFRYKKAFDPQALPQFGLVAEQVAKVNPDLVARDAEGKPFTVRYDEVNAMLLNEFLKEHRKGEQQDRKIEDLEAIVVQLQSALKAQAAQIQKVSEQLGAQAPAPRVVADN